MADGFPRAGDRIRTDDNNVGNVVLYQLSYTRTRKTLLFFSVFTKTFQADRGGFG
jgi:hypothetical protein